MGFTDGLPGGRAVGMLVGLNERVEIGVSECSSVGSVVETCEGRPDGARVGRGEGGPDGVLDGKLDGLRVGKVEGVSVGLSEPMTVGTTLGAAVRAVVGTRLGSSDNTTVGTGLGCLDTVEYSLPQIPQVARQTVFATKLNGLHSKVLYAGESRRKAHVRGIPLTSNVVSSSSAHSDVAELGRNVGTSVCAGSLVANG